MKTNDKNKSLNGKQLMAYWNNELLLELTKEQTNILQSFKFFWKEKLNFENINPEMLVCLNYYHNERKNNGEEFEFDLISIKKIRNRFFTLIWEEKDYSPLLDIKNSIKTDLNHFLNKVETMKDYFFSKRKNTKNMNADNSSIIAIFSWKDDQGQFQFEIHCFDSEMKKIKINSSLLKNFFKNDKSDYHHWFHHNYLDKLLRAARDVATLIASLKNKAKKIINKKIDSNIRQYIINEKRKISLFTGIAGSGKTNLAFTLFKSFAKQSILWLINRNLCTQVQNNLIENNSEDSFANKMFWYSPDVETFFDNNEQEIKDMKSFILLIDEAQRLREDDVIFLEKLIDNFNNLQIILFGDEEQKISNVDFGYNTLIEKFDAKDIFKYELKKCYRIPANTINAIKYSLFLSNKNTSYKNYNLVICNSIEKFFVLFNGDNPDNNSRVICSLQYTDHFGDDLELREKGIMPAERNLPNRENFLFILQFLKTRYFFPYDLISREIDECFVFLSKNVIFNENNKIVFKQTGALSENELLNQINVLVTRATKRLVIFIANENYRNKALQRSSKLKKS